jgi:hypothetical protein
MGRDGSNNGGSLKYSGSLIDLDINPVRDTNYFITDEFQSSEQTTYTRMGFQYVFGASPAVESVSFRLKLYDFFWRAL